MAIPVIMPRQGQSVETCILGQWYKKPGEVVAEGDILFSYETDKASFEEEAKADGILLATFFEEGDEIPVLVNVGVIGKKGESTEEFRPGAESSEAEEKETEPVDEESFAEPKKDVQPAKSEGRIKISPLAKNMAASLNIEVASLKGSGPGGRIIARDVEAESKSVRAEKAEPVVRKDAGPSQAVLASAKQLIGDDFEVKPIPNIRKLIATAMHQSLQNSAQLTHHMSADARKVLALRKKFKAQLAAGEIAQNITINDLVCFAVIKALKVFPQVNTHYLGTKMKWFKKVHLGLAVDTERGLMVPTVQNADDLSIEGLSSQLGRTAAAARSGSIDPDLLKPESATFTISNLGNYGVEMFTPVINLPQTAILGVCTIIPRPMDLGNGVYGFVPMMGLSLTYDHRALDGGEATLFLAEVKKQIEIL